jgi:hypothetical protein
VNRDELRQRFREAAATLRRLPMPKNGLPAGFRTTWPDIAYEWLAYATPTKAPRIPPSPAEITRLDQALGWLHLPRGQRVILWARARGWTWRQVEAIDEMERDGHGRQEQWLRTILGDAEARSWRSSMRRREGCGSTLGAIGRLLVRGRVLRLGRCGLSCWGYSGL